MPELTADFFASPQIKPEDIPTLKDQGYSTLINNRPDHEEPNQPTSDQIKTACNAQDIQYYEVPIDNQGITLEKISLTIEAIKSGGKIFAFCRSGMRSTVMHTLAQAHMKTDPLPLIEHAGKQGYDISHLTEMFLDAYNSNTD